MQQQTLGFRRLLIGSAALREALRVSSGQLRQYRISNLLPHYVLPFRCILFEEQECRVVFAKYVALMPGLGLDGAGSIVPCPDFLDKFGLSWLYSISIRQIDVYRKTAVLPWQRWGLRQVRFHVPSCNTAIRRFRVPAMPHIEAFLNDASNQSSDKTDPL